MLEVKKLIGGRHKIRQNVQFVLRDKDGKIKPLYQENVVARFFRKLSGITLPKMFLFGSYKNALNISNLVTYAGYAGASSRINGAGSEEAFTYIAIGTGTTAASTADTILETEITTDGGERASATCSRVTTAQTNDTAQDVVTFTFTGSFAVTESGVLNASSSGVLLARQVFSAINVASGDSLQVTWKFQISV